MKTFEHAKLHAKKYGGVLEDYIDIDNFLDSSKITHGTVKHRSILHHTFGTFLVEQFFGITRVNSEGKTYSTRDIAEDHIIQDLGWLPSPEDYLKHMSAESWMGNPISARKKINMSTMEETNISLKPCND
jgi:hypothetical protein